jgi:hypothetical protein
MATSPETTHGVDVTGHLAAAVASLQVHHTHLQGIGADYLSPSEMLESILGDGRTMGVEHAVLFEVFDI